MPPLAPFTFVVDHSLIHAIQSPFASCEIYEGTHSSESCLVNIKFVQFVVNQNRLNYPNFSSSNNPGQPLMRLNQHQQPPSLQYSPKKPTLEDMMATFIQNQSAFIQSQVNSIKNLEIHMGKIVFSFTKHP